MRVGQRSGRNERETIRMGMTPTERKAIEILYPSLMEELEGGEPTEGITEEFVQEFEGLEKRCIKLFKNIKEVKEKGKANE